MMVTFLGTAAANAYPEPFCQCDNCQEARLLGGASVRKRSAALINDDLLIDLGPDILTASNQHCITLSNVRYCLQTHPHADHLDLSHLLSRSPGYGVAGAPRMHFYASIETLDRAARTFERDLADYSLLDSKAEEMLNFKIHQVEPFHPFSIGPYRVTAFPANHAPSMGALLYAVESGGSAIFYGTDTAKLFEETWEAFHRHNLRFDIVILDHTYGPEEEANDHLSARQVIAHAERMRAERLLTDTARVFATHIAHEGNPAHPKLVEFASQNGYEIAYDGLRV